MNSSSVWFIVAAALAIATAYSDAAVESQSHILRRVIKSTPTANQLARVRAVSVRSVGAERGGVSEISSREAANFGRRSFASEQAIAGSQPTAAAIKSATGDRKEATTRASSTTTTTTTTTAESTTPAATTTSTLASTTVSSTAQPTKSTTTTESTSSTGAPATTSTRQTPARPSASERQRVSPTLQGNEVELLASAPSSWQSMSAVEAPAVALIMAGPRAAQQQSSNDLSSSSSELETSSSDFLRSSGTKGGSYSSSSAQLVGETFSRLRQQSASKTAQQQQQQTSYFYPQPAPQQPQQLRTASKTSQYNQQATKTHWYQPPSTTPRPAPVYQQQEQQYEQQNEQYVEQQQVEGAAPPGLAEPFAFDFNTQDNSGNGQYRKEESDRNGVVRGSYGYTDANGIYRHVEYVADQNGFRANIKSNEPGLIGETQPASIKLDGASSPSGLASPAATSQRLTEAAYAPANDWSRNNGNNNNPGEQNEPAEAAVAPPDFESSHRSERIRAPRNYRN